MLKTTLDSWNIPVVKAVFLHQEAQNNCSTPRNACITMNKSFASNRKTTVKESFNFLEVLNDIFCYRVFYIYNQVPNERKVCILLIK